LARIFAIKARRLALSKPNGSTVYLQRRAVRQ